jgi:tetratricopeptide (TPR) repeat protein
MFDKFNMHQKYSLLVVLMLIILTIGVYWSVQNYEFINFDDNIYVTENSHTQSGITLEGLRWAFSTKYFGLWNPLVWLSFMFDYQLFGFNAGGYHWTNVIIHIFNIVLLFFLFRNLTGAVWRSAFVAALFAIHPINVESVAWIAERKNVLSTFFWMLTMLFYVWYVNKPNWKRYLPVFISFDLGLMSKPMLVTLPFVLLLIDYWPLNRTAINTRNEIDALLTLKAGKEKLSFLILEKIPLFILSAVTIFVTVYSPESNSQPQFLMTTDFIQRVNNAIYSYVIYLKKFFWPADLSIIYLYLNIPFWQIFSCAIFLIIITILVCIYFKKYPYLPVGWFWYLGTLVPVIGFVPIGDHTMADRYAYLTFIGLFVIIAWGAEQISSKTVFFKKLIIFASVLIILLFTIAAQNQIKVWANTTTLFENAIKKNPDNYLACQIIGQEMAKNSKNEKALRYYDMALKANPKFWPAYNNKGLILKIIGRREEAFENFQKAIKVNKFSVEAYHNIGVFYYENNKFDESVKYFLKAIEIDPLYIESYNYLGVALVEKGNIEEGINYFEKALNIDPNNINAQKNMKIVLQMKKNFK